MLDFRLEMLVPGTYSDDRIVILLSHTRSNIGLALRENMYTNSNLSLKKE